MFIKKIISLNPIIILAISSYTSLIFQMSTINSNLININNSQPNLTTYWISHSKLKFPISFWLIGLIICIVAYNIKLSDKNRLEYEKMLTNKRLLELKPILEKIIKISQNLENAKNSWFWRLNSKKRNKIKIISTELQKENRKFKDLLEFNELIENKAKQKLGIFSQLSITEVKSMFYNSFQRGKRSAKNMSTWDLIFGITFERNRSFFEFLIKFILSMLFNITIGFISALFIFSYRLVLHIIQYKPNFLVGSLFYIISLLGSISLLISILGLIFTSVGGIMAVAIKYSRNYSISREFENRSLNSN